MVLQGSAFCVLIGSVDIFEWPLGITVQVQQHKWQKWETIGFSSKCVRLKNSQSYQGHRFLLSTKLEKKK